MLNPATALHTYLRKHNKSDCILISAWKTAAWVHSYGRNYTSVPLHTWMTCCQGCTNITLISKVTAQADILGTADRASCNLLIGLSWQCTAAAKTKQIVHSIFLRHALGHHSIAKNKPVFHCINSNFGFKCHCIILYSGCGAASPV